MTRISRIILYFSLLPLSVMAQPAVVDQVVAIVGNQILLLSDIERQYAQYAAQGQAVDESAKCILFDQMIMQKLLLNQAAIDSITVSDAQVDEELNKRMHYYITQIGSEERLEEYFH